MSTEDERKKERLVSSSSTDALTRPNLRMQVEKTVQIKKEEEHALTQLKDQVQQGHDQDDKTRKENPQGTKSKMEKADQQQNAGASQKPHTEQMLEQQKVQKEITEKQAKEEKMRQNI